MKKLGLLLLLGGLVLTSCQREELNTYVDGTEFKAKVKINETESESDSESDGCETAFGRYCECASQNTCFSDFGISRWGWSVELNSYRSYKFNLFAGAGKCEIDKGEYVGYVYVTFNGDGTVTYGDVKILDGFKMTEFHFFSGDSEMPLKGNGDMTAAPGQYTNSGDQNGDKKVFVIVHASVCKDQE